MGLPAPDLVLVNDEDLSYAKVRFDAGSLATALACAGACERSAGPQPGLVRAVECHARCPPAGQELHSGSGGHGGAEADISLLQTLVDNAIEPLNSYCPPAESCRAARNRWHCRRGKPSGRSAAPGSDEQLVWARTLAGVGRGSDAVAARVRGAA